MLRSLRKDDNALLFQMLVGAGLVIIIFFAIMNVGTFINSNIAQEISDQYDVNCDEGDHSASQIYSHRMMNTSKNLSGDYDNVIDSLSIAAVVMAITLPLAAVVAIRKFF